MDWAVWGRMMAHRVSVMCNDLRSKYSGTTIASEGIIMPSRKR